MKGRFRRWFIIGLLVFAVCFLQKVRTQAAVAQITIQKSQQEIVKGDIFYVIITVASDEEIKGFEGYFSYNQNVMQFITGGSVASGNDDEIHIKDLNRDKGTRKIKYSLQFRARKAGISSVALKRYRQIKKAEEDTKLSVGSASLEIEVISEKKYQKRIERQERQEKLQRAEDEMEESPAASATVGGLSDQLSGLSENQHDAVENNRLQPTAATSERIEKSRESGGLTKKICIVILCLAAAGFVIVAALLVNTLKKDEGAGGEERLITDCIENSGRMDQNIDSMEWDVDPANQEKRLNEIEKRLEEKRRWLRKE